MAHTVYDRVRETTLTTGTGTITLAGAQQGFRAFGDVFAVNDTTYYAIALGSDWEIGLGTYSAANALSRTTVLASSNAGGLVSFGAGTKEVFDDFPAAVLATLLPTGTPRFKSLFLDPTPNLDGTPSVNSFTLAGVGYGLAVPYLRAGIANSITAFDLFPSGTPTGTVNTQMTWIDICSEDSPGNPGVNFYYSRVGIKKGAGYYFGGFRSDNTNMAAVPMELAPNSAVAFRLDSTAFWPTTTNARTLGTSTLVWSNIYSQNAVTVTSDERDKIKLDKPVPGLAFIRDIAVEAAMFFRWKAGDNDLEYEDMPGAERDNKGGIEQREIAIPRSGKRTHAGFGAQTVKAIMDRHGVDFGAYTYTPASKDAEGNAIRDKHGMRPEQLIPSLCMAISEMAARIEVLEARAA